MPRFRVGPGGEGIKSFNSPIPSQSKLKSALSAQVSSCIQGMLRGGTAIEDGVHLYLAAALRHACVKASSNSCACGRVSWSLKFFSFFFFLVQRTCVDKILGLGECPPKDLKIEEEWGPEDLNVRLFFLLF